VSSTVAHRVLRGETVLFKDTGTDAELMKAESIMNMRLRSIICVPIRGKFGVLGILYIDSDRADTRYTHEHLMLSTAVGNSAGLALENARMHQAMLDKQRIEQEIEYAASIQEGFLVKSWPDDDSRFRVYGEMRPAKTVGGDFYDFIRPSDDTVGILIGDVSGKGVPAALAMAQLLAEFRAQSARQSSPEAVLTAMNASFVKKSKRGMFCTLCYLVIDLKTGNVTSANAGHHPVVHTSKDGAHEVDAPSGLPIGILADERWPDSEFSMAKGDSIVLYTDGIIEARCVQTQTGNLPAAKGQEYSVEHLISFLGLKHEKEPRELSDAVLEDVRRFCEPASPHDDCTLIAFRYLG
jgi:sigma-B regulation protein RsbU (phosphoserine phosphatase)